MKPLIVLCIICNVAIVALLILGSVARAHENEELQVPHATATDRINYPSPASITQPEWASWKLKVKGLESRIKELEAKHIGEDDVE